jgi:6-phosphogluconate dehydrogenase
MQPRRLRAPQHSTACTVRNVPQVFLMVKAGQPVDDFIEQLLPFLEEGDIIIDGPLSRRFFPTSRARQMLAARTRGRPANRARCRSVGA